MFALTTEVSPFLANRDVLKASSYHQFGLSQVTMNLCIPNQELSCGLALVVLALALANNFMREGKITCQVGFTSLFKI